MLNSLEFYTNILHNILYAGAIATPEFSHYGFGFGTTHMTRVGCTGIETNLLNCSYSTDYFEIYYFCDYYYFGYGSAGVSCQRGTKIDSIMEYSKLQLKCEY